MAPAPMTIADVLRSSGLDPIDARVLLQHALSVSHAYLIAHSERTLTDAQSARIHGFFERRIAGEPVAYIVGRREFFGREFLVTPAVLIPRPETELLVEIALDRMRGLAAPRVLDLGTGSGCIAITLALEQPNARLWAVDASADALRIATTNAQNLGVTNVAFVHGSWLRGIGQEKVFDLIVGNPPYVADADPHLSEGDLRFEPRSALAAGLAGLDDIAAIVADAPGHLRPGGWLLLEHGWDQGAAVEDLLARAGFEDRLLARDLGGQPRVSGGRTPAAR